MYPTRTRHAAPISMTPHKGPFEPFFSNPDDETMLREHELIVVIILKTFCAFEWVQVLAQFVRVYNNLNPDTQAFSAGWDALNRFVSYFRIDHTSAAELRRYYVERAEEARALSRKRVVNDFSPYLREKFVWMLNKEWLVDVPCFSFVVERLKQRPESGMERFLVEIALAMHPAVFVPTERPPPLRLYIVTEGMALHRGKRLAKGTSWGAEDVLQNRNKPEKCVRALAVNYLHVLFIGVETFDKLQGKDEYKEAYRLTKMWATLYSVGDFMLATHRKVNKTRHRVRFGTGEGDLNPVDVERRINSGSVRVVVKKDAAGVRESNSKGQTLYEFKHKTIDMTGYYIIKDGHNYRVKAEVEVLLPPAAQAPSRSVSPACDPESFTNKLKQRAARGNTPTIVRPPSQIGGELASEIAQVSAGTTSVSAPGGPVDLAPSPAFQRAGSKGTKTVLVTLAGGDAPSPQASPLGFRRPPAPSAESPMASESMTSRLNAFAQSLEAQMSRQRQEGQQMVGSLQSQIASIEAQLRERDESQAKALAELRAMALATGQGHRAR